MKIGRAELLGHFKQGSAEWHEARRGYIGGSDVASILGVGYLPAFVVWQEKAGLLEPEPVDEAKQRKFDYGHHMEPFVADIFRRKHPELSVHDEPGTWISTKYPWTGCNPDRLISLFDRDVSDSHAVLQIKTALWDYEEDPPEGYEEQLRHEMDVFGFAKGFLGVYFNGSGNYREWEFEADPFRQDAIRARLRTFADSLTAGEPPEIDGSELTYRAVRRLNPSLKRGEEKLIPEEIALEYLGALQNFKLSESELFRWKGHMLAHMGTAQFAIFGGKRIASRIAKGDNPPYLQESK